MVKQEQDGGAIRLFRRHGPWHRCVKHWATRIPTELAVVWLNGQADPVVTKTYEELDFEATKLALALKATYGCQAGEHLILCYPPGLDFVVAFIACQMLGVVPVPVYYPTRSHRHLNPQRLLALARRTKALQFWLTSSSCRTSVTADWGAESTGGLEPDWIFTDDVVNEGSECRAGGLSECFALIDTAPTDVAFLQFSSGSTKTPKGCLITQAGLLHNIHHNWFMSGIYSSARKKAIYDVPSEQYREFTEDFQSLALQRWGHRLRFVSWLPVTHDMGLVGMIGVPLFFGCTAYFMSPQDFLKNPPVWFEAFGKHQCSITAAPDFAYALASNKERTCPLPIPSLPEDQSTVRRLVGCGCTHGDVVVKIVHPDTLEELQDWHVGEVWVSSPSCALAYYDDPDSTAVFFGVQIKKALKPEDTPSRYLRTGDLGFLGEGELYVTGRLKNILIVCGKNYYLQEFEDVLESCSCIRKGCVMAFPVGGIAEDSEENLGVAAEVDQSLVSTTELVAIAEEMRRIIFQDFQLPIHSLWLAEAGTLPKTTSGKPRRHAARKMLEKGSCQGVLYGSHLGQPYDVTPDSLSKNEVAKPREEKEISALLPSALNTYDADGHQTATRPSEVHTITKRLPSRSENPSSATTASVETTVFECFKNVFGRCTLPIDKDTPLEVFGLDSLSAVELGTTLSETLGIKVEPFAIFEFPDVGGVVAAMENLLGIASSAYSLQRHLTDSMTGSQYDVYITGMACKFPRECNDPTEFWARLLQGYQFIGPPPPGRYPKLCNQPTASIALNPEGKLQGWQGGMINDISLFDNNYFCISAAEAAAMDPQQRLLLMQSVEALYSREGSLTTTGQTGVYVGCCSEDWCSPCCTTELFEPSPLRELVGSFVCVLLALLRKRLSFAGRSHAFTATAQSSCMLANRVSYCLNLTGPSVTVDTACSSSLVALHCAWQEMTSCGSRCSPLVETALVAAVNLILVFDTTLALQRSGFLSPTYRCRTFDAAADGFVRSEGVAAVVLERIRRPESCETKSPGAAKFQDDAELPAQQYPSSASAGDELGVHHASKLARASRLQGQGQGRDCCYLRGTATVKPARTLPPGTLTKEVCVPGQPSPQGCAKERATPEKRHPSSSVPRRAWCRLAATAVVHGGKAASLMAPCRTSQEQLCRQILSVADTTPDEICFIETHGTGTALGDPIEIGALVNVFKSTALSRCSPLILGAVKTNLGHLEGAAGMAGLLKCALCLAQGKIPANLHLKTINPYLDFQQLPVILPCKTVPLTFNLNQNRGRADRADISKRTSGENNSQLISEESMIRTRTVQKSSRCIVTALGFGGTYAQALLLSFPQDDKQIELKDVCCGLPKRLPWTLNRLSHQNFSELAPQQPLISPAYLWRIGWELIALDDLQENNDSMSCAASFKRTSFWLVVTFQEASEAFWKTLSLRDVRLIVHTMAADVSEEALRYLLESKSWQVILFVEGAHVNDITTAIENILVSSRLIPFCGKLLLQIHPKCKMLLLTRGSQIAQPHAASTLPPLNDPPPYAAGMLGCTRACRANIRYSTGKPFPLYFIDLDPAFAVDRCLRALVGVVQNLKEDELDMVVRQGKIYAPKLWCAGPLLTNEAQNREENHLTHRYTKAISPQLPVEESNPTACSKMSCCVSANFPRSPPEEDKFGVHRQCAIRSNEEHAPCACRVRLICLCGNGVDHLVDKTADSANVLLGCSGIVVGVGDEAHHLRIGDAVCGFVSSPLGEDIHTMCTTCTHLLQRIPPSFSFEEAAAIPSQLAQILRAAGHQVRCSSKCNFTIPDVLKNCSDGGCFPKTGHEESMKMSCTDRGSNTGRDTADAHVVGEREAGGVYASDSNSIGSNRTVLDTSGWRKIKRSGAAVNSGDLSRQANQIVQSPTLSHLLKVGGGESADKEEDEAVYGERTETKNSCPLGSEAADRVDSSKEVKDTNAQGPPTGGIIVDGSAAGLLAALYFRDVGYEVVGLPLSTEQRHALVALGIPVLVTEDASIEQAGEKFAPSECELEALRSWTSEPGVVSNCAAFERKVASVGRPVSKSGVALPAVREQWPPAKDAIPAGGRLVRDNAVPRPNAVIRTGGVETEALRLSQIPVEETGCEHRPFPEQSRGGVAVATSALSCFTATTAFYCVLRSQQYAKLLLPWMGIRSAVFDFSCSRSSQELQKWLFSKRPGIKYWNCVISSNEDTSEKLLQLADALRSSCDFLANTSTSYRFLDLHVFPDIDLHKGATLHEACKFIAAGTYVGCVVCSYSTPILHVASAFINSPSTHSSEPASSAASASLRKDSCMTAGRGQQGRRILLTSQGKAYLHNAVPAMDEKEACGQLHSNVVADSPTEHLNCPTTAAGNMEEINLISAEERRCAAYIVAGGPLGLSTALARWLVEEGAQCVVMLQSEDNLSAHVGEGAVSKEAQDTQTAACITSISCSLQSQESIQKALQQIRELPRFPPLRGFFHVPFDTLPACTNDGINEFDDSRFVLEHKALAAWNFHCALNELHMEDSLQLFVLFSGDSGLFGRTNCEAAWGANTMLDMLALYRSRQGLSGLSIQWSAWRADVAKPALDLSRSELLACDSKPSFSAGSNMGGICGVFHDLCALRKILALHLSGHIGAVVACFEAEGVFAEADGVRVEAVLSGKSGWMPKPAASIEKQRLQTISAGASVLPRETQPTSFVLKGDDIFCWKEDILYNLVYKEVCSLVESYLILENDQKLSPHETMDTLGMDSLTAAELKYELQSRFQVVFDDQILCQQATIKTIASSIFSGLCLRICSAPSNGLSNTMGAYARDSIAVVSMALRLPGGCSCPGTLWGMLLAGTDCSRALSTFDRAIEHTLATRKNSLPPVKACYLESEDTFDTELFQLHSADALSIDRQSQLLVAVAYEALFNVTTRHLQQQSGLQFAVYVAGSAVFKPSAGLNKVEHLRSCCSPKSQSFHGSRQQCSDSSARLGLETTLNSSLESLPGVISYLLSLSGTSVLVDTGGTSSLSALCLAADHLGSNRDAEAAVVGAVRLLPVETHSHLDSAGALRKMTVRNTPRIVRGCAPADRCRSSEIQDIQGEGVMAVVLQKESVAESSANPILAVIRGSCIQHVGRRAISAEGERAGRAAVMQSVLENARARAGAAHRDVGLVEVTGEDFPVDGFNPELESVAHVYGRQKTTQNDFPVVITCIKGNVGCLREAAGLAGFIKVVLMLAQSRFSDGGLCAVIPPSLRMQHTSKILELVSGNDCRGILFPCKCLVRCRLQADAASSQRCAASFMSSCPSLWREKDDAAVGSLPIAAERQVSSGKGGAAFPPMRSLLHPSRDSSTSSKESLVPMAGFSSSSVPCGLCVQHEDRDSSVSRSNDCANSSQKNELSYKQPERFLGGVTASASSGLVMHLLLEGGRHAIETSSSFTKAAQERRHNEHKQLSATCSQARAFNRQPTCVIRKAPATGRRGAYNGSMVATSAEGASVAAVECFAGAASSGKRCLWLFHDDHLDALYCGRPLYFTSQHFAQEIDRCSKLMQTHLPASLRQILYPRCEAELLVSKKLLRQPQVARLSLFALQWSLANHLRKTACCRAIAVAGVGVGETVAAAVAGLLSLEEAIHLVGELASNLELNKHTNNAQVFLATSDRDTLLAKVDAHRTSLQLSSLENHRVDYGLSTDGEQTYRSDCLSLCDSTDASCRSVFTKHGTYPTSVSGGQHTQQESARFGSPPLFCDNTDQLVQDGPRFSFVSHASALSTGGTGERRDAKTLSHEQAAVDEPQTCCAAISKCLQRNYKERSWAFSDTARRSSDVLSRSPAQCTELVDITSPGATPTLCVKNGIPQIFPETITSVRSPGAYPALPSALPESAGGPGTCSLLSGAAKGELAASQLSGSNLTQPRRRGSCGLPTRACTTLPCLIYGAERINNSEIGSATPTPISRRGSLVDLNMTDIYQCPYTPASCTSTVFASSYPSSNAAEARIQNRSARDDLRCVDVRERHAFRVQKGRRSAIGGATMLHFAQIPTPSLAGQRLSLQHATPAYSKVAYSPVETPQFDNNVCLAAGEKASCSEEQKDISGGGFNVLLEKNSEREPLSADEYVGSGSGTGPGKNTPPYSSSNRKKGEFRPPARTVAPTDTGIACSHQRNDYSGSSSTLGTEVECFKEKRQPCLQCENIRKVVGRISMSRATCVFLSAALGTAAPERLLRDPLYWDSKLRKKLRLRTTVKVAKRVLHIAAIVLVGPPAAGSLQATSLLKLAKHVDVLRFSGCSDTLEAIIPCKMPTATERAATVRTDVALRFPYAAPCWKNTDPQSSDNMELDLRLFPPTVRGRQPMGRIPLEAVHAHRMCSLPRTWTSFSD